MSQRYDEDEHEDWEADDDEPQPEDLDDEDETPTVPCPSCRRAIPDFADRCPYCGDWVVQSSGAPARRNPWFVVAVIAVVVAFLYWLLR